MTATSTHIDGRPTDPPTTCGYMRLPSICCSTMNMMRKTTAFFGSSTSIMIVPAKHPTNAPRTGISANTAINMLTVSAYGIRNTVIVMKNISPSMHASRHCPDINFEKVLSASTHVWMNLSAFLSLNTA